MALNQNELYDIESIKNVAKRYCRGVDRLDAEEMRSAYWPDATDDHGVFVGNAWEFVDFCMEAHLHWRSTSHCIFNHVIEFDSDQIHARGEIYNISYLLQRDNDILDTWHGRYLDLYQKRNNEWRILERVCVHDFTNTNSISPMDFDSSGFRQGDFDRKTPGRKIGP